MYEEPTLKALIAKLNADGPAALRNKYVIGDPLVVPESKLPLCFVSKDILTISNDSNTDDKHDIPVVLNVVYKFTKELNQKTNVQAGTSGLYELCEARNADYSLKSGSIAHVLRSNEVLDAANRLYIDADADLVIEYLISPPSRRGFLSDEAVIRTKLVSNQTRPV